MGLYYSDNSNWHKLDLGCTHEHERNVIFGSCYKPRQEHNYCGYIVEVPVKTRSQNGTADTLPRSTCYPCTVRSVHMSKIEGGKCRESIVHVLLVREIAGCKNYMQVKDESKNLLNGESSGMSI